MSLRQTRRTSTGLAVLGRCRVFGLWVVGGATNGTVALIDSSLASGSPSTMAVFGVPGITTTGTTAGAYIPLVGGTVGDNGMLFQTGCTIQLTTAVEGSIIFRQEGV